jgi:transposase
MNLHANAALSLNKRRQLARRVVEEKLTLAEAARVAEVSVRTAQKWSSRFRAEGEAGLIDRSSAPCSCPHATPEDRVQAIVALRRLRLTGAEIAEALAMAETTVSGILKRIGMGRLGRLGLEPERRYERSRPGELVHVDVKKLGRIIRPGHRVTGRRFDRRDQGKKGWEFVHIAIDDATRLAYVEVLEDERAPTAVAFWASASILRPLRDQGRARDQRQRLLLPRQAARALLPNARYPPPLHPPLPSPDQRQSGALHPHHARRLGLWGDLPLELRANRGP